MPHRDTSLTISVNTDTSNQLMNVSTIRHDPHGYNPMNNQPHAIQGMISLAIDVNTDTSNQIDQYQYSRYDLRWYVSMRFILLLIP